MPRRYRVTGAIAAAVASSLAMAQQASQPSLVNMNIDAQPLDKALNSWADQTGYQVLIPTDKAAGERTSPPLKGTYTPEGALRILLARTDLTFQFVNARTVTIRPATTSDSPPAAAPPATKPESSRPLVLAQGRPRETEEATARDSEGNPNRQSKNREITAEVVVTAQKRSERLLDVPVPVTAVRADSLMQSNQVRLQDFYARVPGFSVAPSPGAGGQQSISIRGISTGSYTVPTVGITVDDVPYGSSTNFAGSVIPDIDPSDLDRIEVLRGPQGTLYGASSMGGLLKLVTVDPSTDSLKGRLEIGTSGISNGSGAGYNARGAVNIPLSDTIAIRASGFTREVPGYIDNPVLGEDAVNEQRVSGGRLSGLWQPNDAFSVKLSALYQRDRGDSSNEVTVVPGLGDLEQNYIRGTGSYERKSQAYSATLSAKFGKMDVVSISGYNVNEFFNSGDSTYSLGTCCTEPIYGVVGSPLLTMGSTKKFTQEIRATMPLGARVELLVGGFYAHEDSPYRQINLASVPQTGEIIAQSWDSTYPSKYREYGEFATLTVRVTDRFDVQFGGREAQIRQKFGPCVYTGPLFGDGGCPLTPSSADSFTYLVTPRLKITPDVMVYARAASGFRAGGPNVFNPNPAVPRQYEPDKTKTYEVGLKGDLLDRTLSFDASVFRIDFDNLQINLLDTNFLVYTSNGSSAKSQGVELSVEARPLGGLTIAAWGTYTDAELSEAMPSNTAINGAKGARLPYSTRVSGNLSLNQDFSVTSQVTGFVGGAVSYVGDREGTFVGGTTVRQSYPSYTKIDLSAGFRYDSWVASLYGNNIGDRRGVLGGGAGTYPPFAFTLIQPRTIGVSLTKTF